MASAQIEEGKSAIVLACNNNVKVFVIESHLGDGRCGLKSLLRSVRVGKVPNVGFLGHVGGHLLEAELGIRHTNPQVSARIGMPHDLCCCSFNLVGVFKDHHSFSVDGLRQMLGLLTVEVLLKQVDLIILFDALLCVVDEISSGRCVAEGWVTHHLLVVLRNIVWLVRVSFLGPAYAEFNCEVTYHRRCVSCRDCWLECGLCSPRGQRFQIGRLLTEW